MKYDTIVFIGRFQPLHNAHKEIIVKAATLAKELIIMVGSANQPRTFKNPWTYIERKLMIMNTLDELDLGNCRVHIESVEDSMYNDDLWALKVQSKVALHKTLSGTVGIIGHRKDESSFYLDLFPQWQLEEVDAIEVLHASQIRDMYFCKDRNIGFIKSVVPAPVFRALEGWQGPEYNQIIAERYFIEKYTSQFESLPYAPVFVTVDAVVTCAGHVLMIRRRSEPGKGLWAIPGGFLNANTDRSCEAAMLRELKEETNIKVPVPVLRGCIGSSRVFDAINRSTRGRTITHAFLISLPIQELPKVRGSDDADKAKWVPFSELNPSECYEDHYEIITTMVGL